MPSTITSAALYGIDARPVTVEVDVQPGLPNVTVVGLPDAAVQEARERVRSAIKNSGAFFPLGRVTINLAPADWRKAGSGYDLAVAVAILVATEQLPPIFDHDLLIGELTLSGDCRPTPGVLAVAELARQLRRRLHVPQANAREAAMITSLHVVPQSSLRELITHTFTGQPWPEQARVQPPRTAPIWNIWPTIQGQANAKRAMVIAAAGAHNVLLIGPPGSGKTMLARGCRELLPPLTEAESLLVTRIHSINGLLPVDTPLIIDPPFRQPHHTASVAALVGGGRVPKPGELTMAHHGLLFLDEFAEFSREHIEALRQPLEDGIITVSRVAGTVQFPAAAMIVAAMNPCPCGYLHDARRVCTCPPTQVRRYHRRISGPVLDRFDLFIHVPRVPLQDIVAGVQDDPRPVVTSARSRQTHRHRGGIPNSQLRGRALLDHCPLGPSAQQLLHQALDRLQLSMRAYHRILRVSRTIADLAGADAISTEHLAEALHYRPPGLLDDGRARD